jgi:hypothetical protein
MFIVVAIGCLLGSTIRPVGTACQRAHQIGSKLGYSGRHMVW